MIVLLLALLFLNGCGSGRVTKRVERVTGCWDERESKGLRDTCSVTFTDGSQGIMDDLDCRKQDRDVRVYFDGKFWRNV